jgi:hypothetical protein
MKTSFLRIASLALAGVTAGPLLASSHREAPLITTTPKVDGTDFYMFSSYEPGRSNYVTFVADYIPLQDAYGGPNFFEMDPNALYEIHIDNSGDAKEDLTFQFRFQNALRNISLVIGSAGNQRTNAVPVLAVGQISAGNNASLNVDQTYTITLINGPRRTGAATPISNAADGTTTFTKPQDYVGEKTFPDYNTYANQYIYNITLPGTTNLGRVFVGQRKDPFVVNLGETFDLVNITPSPLGSEDAGVDTLADKNVTAICLELPKDFLRGGPSKPVIGGWTTASMIAGGQTNQVSRLGMPLVNEVVIGVKDKDKFNASEPKDDLANFVDYVTHPTLPAIIELLYGAAGVKAPTLFPRADLVAVFATGVTGLNADGGVGELVRLNMDVAATPRDSQNNMGVVAGYAKGVLDATKADLAGFPNGRRPGDDVIDIALRVVMGKLLTPDVAPSGDLPFTDGATVNASVFQNAFPYLNPPIKGSPNDPTITFTPQSSGGVGGAYKPVQGTFDPATQTLTVPKPAGDTGFLRLQSDRKTTLSNPEVTTDSIKAKVN